MKAFITRTMALAILYSLVLACDKEEADPFLKDSGEFTDVRDNIKYKWVRIGQQIWMAENLAYDAGYKTWEYEDDEANVPSMGRLYEWEAAQLVCPVGWHLPNFYEWEQLATFINNEEGPYNKGGDDWYGLGIHLKATGGWANDGNGTDDFGFKALPGGLRYDNEYGYIGEFGAWWSATERSDTHAWVRGMTNFEDDFYRYDYPKENAFSIRCIKD